MIAGGDQIVHAFVFLGMQFGITHHPLDFILAQAAGGGDTDGLLLAGGLVLGGHMQDTVGINIKGDFNLGNATRCRRYVGQIKPAQRFVVA